MGKKLNIIALVVLGIFLVGFFLANTQKKEFISSESPSIMNIVHKNYISGILSPKKEVKIKSQISGILKKIYVKAGDTIKTGDLIAEINLLPNPQNIETAHKILITSKINFDKCEREYLKYKALFTKKLVAELEYNKYKDAYLLSNEEFISAKKQLQIIKKGYSEDQKNIPNFIRSTVSGTILEIPLKEGASITERNNYNEGSIIAVIANLESLIFKAKVNEKDITYLKSGMKLKLEVNALKKQKINAYLTHIIPKAKEENGIMKFEIEAKVENHPDTQLYPGFSAVAEMILDKRDSVLTIKERNLIFKNDSIFVELLDLENQINKRLVKTGLSDGLRIEITEGLSLGDRVKVQTN